MKKRVVITGIGPVVYQRTGKNEFWQSILEMRIFPQKISTIFTDHYNYNSKYYIPFPEEKIENYDIPRFYDKIMSVEDKITIIGAKLALQDSGFDIQKTGRKFQIPTLQNTDVILGTGFSGLENSFRSYVAHLFSGQKNNIPQIELNRFHRMIIPMTMPNSVAAWLSILFNFKGSSYTINASCASGTFAIGEAFRRIKDGYSKIVISGGVECLKEKNGSVMRGFDVLGALTKSEDGLPIPFSKDRSGFLFCEGGACILVLEELEQALGRGAQIYAEIIDFKSNSDAHNIVKIDESGKQITKLLRGLVKNRQIDYFNSHGTGTLLNDQVEANSILEIFGDKNSQPKINSTKGLLGHSIGASGALETAVTALSIKHQKVHGNQTPNQIENLNLISESTDLNIEYAISGSYGFGGHNGGLLLKKYVEN